MEKFHLFIVIDVYKRQDTYKASLEYQPDIVLIKLGTNDTKPQNWKYKNEFKDRYSFY